MKGGGSQGERREERAQQPFTVDSRSLVNSRYEILTKQPGLYEKCMTSCRELTRKADEGARAQCELSVSV